MDLVLAAVDVTGVSTKVVALLVSFVGINLAFLGYRFAKKLMGRG